MAPLAEHISALARRTRDELGRDFFLSRNEWRNAESDPFFLLFLRSCLLLGIIIVSISLYIDIHEFGVNIFELISITPFLIGSAIIIFAYGVAKRLIHFIIPSLFFIMNIGFIFINLIGAIQDPLHLDSLAVISSTLFFGINSIFFKKQAARLLNFSILITTSVMCCEYEMHAPRTTAGLNSAINFLDVWLLSIGVFATQLFANYTREKNFLRLDEAYRKLDELETHRVLLNENARIRDELARLGRVSIVEAMATTISHETNQPIGAALTFAQAAKRWLIRNPPELSEATGALDGAIAQIQRAGDIIASVRRVTARNVHSNQETGVWEAFGALMPLLEIYTKNYDIDFQFSISNFLESVKISISESELTHIMMNLMQNSIDSFDEKQEIRKILIIADIYSIKNLRLIIKDNGCGISEHDLSQAFDIFYTTKGGGTGLGLPICREIVEHHGGKLELSSTVGAGSTVTITLPLLQSP